MAKFRIEDSDLAREVNDTSGHPLRKSPHESDAEYSARVQEFMKDREVVDTSDEDEGEFDREANESDDVEIPTRLAQEIDMVDTDADKEDGETRAWDTRETR